MKSPLRFFFVLALLCLLSGLAAELAWRTLAAQISINNTIPGGQRLPHSLALADYWLMTGDVNTAISEYKLIAENSDPAAQSFAQARIDEVLSMQQTFQGRFSLLVANLLWDTYPRLYILAGLLGLTWFVLLLVKWIRRRSSFVFLSVVNSTDIHAVEKLPALVIERMQEIESKTENAQNSINTLVCEQLEIPPVGLVEDAKNANIEKVVDTAWAMTSGISSLSLSELLRSLRLWINAPRHVITGSVFETDSTVEMRLVLRENDTGKIDKTWQLSVPLDCKSSAVSILVDDTAFVLFHHFNTTISTRNWRALQSLTRGIHCFARYFTENKAGALEEAEQALQTALGIDPDYAVARYNLGLVLMTAGQFDASRIVLKPLVLE